MNIKINEKILSIPPQISTNWSQISSLRMREDRLSVTLTDGETINVTGLTGDQIEQAFSFHAAYLEKQTTPTVRSNPMGMGMPPFGDSTTLSFAFGTVDGISTGMHHNPEQARAPDLPDEVLNRITEIVKALGVFDEFNLPKPEVGCNCFHCQVAEKLSGRTDQLLEEVVPEEELRFEEWLIEQVGDQLYTVVHRLDGNEKHNVFLGDPVSCTCGKEGCEHILAVLKS